MLLYEPNIICFMFKGFSLNPRWRFAHSGGLTLSTSVVATDNSKAVILVLFLFAFIWNTSLFVFCLTSYCNPCYQLSKCMLK